MTSDTRSDPAQPAEMPDATPESLRNPDLAPGYAADRTRMPPAQGAAQPAPPVHGTQGFWQHDEAGPNRYVRPAPARPDGRRLPTRSNGGGRTALWLGLGAVAIAAAGGAYLLANRGQGHPPDSAPGRTARRLRFGDYAVVGRTVTISRSREEVYAFWRDFSNLPGFMENVRGVEEASDGLSRWTIAAPMGQTVTIDTRITDDRPNEQIAWRSVEGSQIETEGKVRFVDAPDGRGTRVTAIISYKPPGGEAGRLIAKMFGREPAIQARRELKRLKMLMETGEVATSSSTRT